MARKPQIGKSLAGVNTELTKQWHPTLNGKLTPIDVTEKSERIVWWKCPKGIDHEWKTKISHRSNGSGCPICKNLKLLNRIALGY